MHSRHNGIKNLFVWLAFVCISSILLGAMLDTDFWVIFLSGCIGSGLYFAGKLDGASDMLKDSRIELVERADDQLAILLSCTVAGIPLVRAIIPIRKQHQ